MPIYEYECGLCCRRFDMKQGVNEAPKAMCPHCQGKSRRVLHSNPIIFRGSGFYVNDYPRGDSGSHKD
ncbi:MAG: zinc ribbon domain-containing protein [Dehalococcoidales bacterium]|nr:zinc ribbon domain-containing protein [Dehalococcoidales bacterium]